MVVVVCVCGGGVDISMLQPLLEPVHEVLWQVPQLHDEGLARAAQYGRDVVTLFAVEEDGVASAEVIDDALALSPCDKLCMVGEG